MKREVIKKRAAVAFVHCLSCGAYVCKNWSCFFGHSPDNINCTRCYQNVVDESLVTRRTSPRNIARKQRTLSQSPPAREKGKRKKSVCKYFRPSFFCKEEKKSFKFCKGNEHTLPTSKSHNFVSTKICLF